MQAKILRYIKKNQMIQKNDKVIVGVSGGADSVCLLQMLKELQKEFPFEIIVVHVNHCLRGEAAEADEQFTQRLSEQYGFLYKAITVDVKAQAKKRGLTIEEAGRMIRREIFEEEAREQGASKIALGQHQDDQAETVLHNLARGSAITGLCGIHPIRDQYIRPLLCVGRNEIEQYLRSNNQPWRDDETNFEEDYTRNKLRHNVLKYLNDEVNQKATKHIADSARSLQEAEEYLITKTKKAMKKYAEIKDGKVFVSQKIASKDRLIQKYVMRECIKKIAGNMKDLSREHINMMVEMFEKEVGKKANIVDGIEIRRAYEGVILARQEKSKDVKVKQEVVVPIPGEFKVEGATFTCCVVEASGQVIEEKTYTKWLDYDKMKGNLVVRSRQPGDVIVTCLGGGKKKLKDYFIDAKIPQEKRDAMLLLAMESEILWIVGDRISEKYKVGASTKQILKIHKEGEETT